MDRFFAVAMMAKHYCKNELPRTIGGYCVDNEIRNRKIERDNIIENIVWQTILTPRAGISKKSTWYIFITSVSNKKALKKSKDSYGETFLVKKNPTLGRLKFL